MVQRTLVRGGPAEFGERGELPEVSGGPSDLVECAEEKLPKLFIERSPSSSVDYPRAFYILQISLMAKLLPLLKPVSLSGQPVGKLEHAKDVVVRNHEQLRRIRKVPVLGEPAGVSVAVRADDRQVPDIGVQPPGDGACVGFGREKPVFFEDRHRAASADAQHDGHRWHVSYTSATIPASCR